jgi:hypothetical protein
MKENILLILSASIFSLALSAFMVSSCTHDSDLIADLDSVCYETQILPIMQTSCALSGCHTGGGGEAGFDATDYNELMGYITPGDARKSVLYKVLTKLYGEKMMPPDRELPEEQRSLIMVWIEQGAKKSACTSDTTPVDPPDTTSTIVDTLCFQQSILPLFVSSCAKSSCHDAISHVEGYNLTDYSHIMNSGDGVVPYNPDETEIYKVLFESGEDRMPPSPLPALTSNQKEAIRRWIAEGALNSDCPDLACDTLNPISYSKQVWPIINNNCTGCHNSSTHSGGVDLSNYTQIVNYATQTRNNVPILEGVINKMSGFRPMPPSSTLDACTIRTIELWIEQGTPNN